MGHCLGLFHTHHGTAINDYAEGGNPEYVNGSNSLQAGDFIEDTPADPCEWDIWGRYCGTGTDANGDIYNPSPINLMSYNGEYRTSFTSKLFDAIRNCIFTNNSLANTIHTRVIEGDNHFCSSAVYNISFLKNNETVNWTVTKYYLSSTADDQPLSSQTTTYSGSSITLNASNQSAYYVIQATINGTTTLTKTVTSYAPSPYVGTLDGKQQTDNSELPPIWSMETLSIYPVTRPCRSNIWTKPVTLKQTSLASQQPTDI